MEGGEVVFSFWEYQARRNIRNTRTFTADFTGSGCDTYAFYGSAVSGFCEDPLLGILSPCGLAPYTYTWQWSPTPSFSPAILLGSGSPLFLSSPPTPGVYYVRLTVTSSDGLTVYSPIRRYACIKDRESKATPEMHTPGHELIAFPNPANQYTNILLPDGCDVKSVSAIQSLGRTLGSLNFVQTGSNNLTVQTNTLGDGMYLLKMITTKGEFYSKLLILAQH